MALSAAQLHQYKSQISVLSEAEVRQILLEVIEDDLEMQAVCELQQRMAHEMAVQFGQKEEECQGLRKQAAEMEKQLKTALELAERLRCQLGLRNAELFGRAAEQSAVIFGKSAQGSGRNKESEQSETAQEQPGSGQEEEKQESAAADSEDNSGSSSEGTGSSAVTISKKEKNRKRAPYKSRREKYENLPVLNVFQWPNEQISEIYGENWTFSHYEYHDRVHVIPAMFYRAHIATPVICVDGQMVRLPLQEDLLPKSDLTADYGAWLVTQRYQNFMPVNRISTFLGTHGFAISRQNLTGKIARVTEQFLGPVAESLREQLRKEDHVQSDETPVPVMKGEDGSNIKGFFWVEATSELTEEHPLITYNYSRHRNTDTLVEIMSEDWAAVMTSDGFSVYPCFAALNEERVNAGCLTHMRRGFVKALQVLKSSAALKNAQSAAVEDSMEAAILKKIAQIYLLDTPAKTLDAKERRKIRDQQIRPVFEQLYALIRKAAAHMDSCSDQLKKAVHYALHQEQALRVFLEDPLVPIDNNFVEQKVRSVALAKRSWDWFGSEDSARTAADCLTLIETAKANEAIPFYYIEYLLKEMPKHLDEKASEQGFYAALWPWSKEYREYEQQAKQHVPELGQLVWPNQKEERLSWFPPLMTEKPSRRKADRRAAAAVSAPKAAAAQAAIQ